MHVTTEVADVRATYREEQLVKNGGTHANYQAVREYQTARAHNSGVLTTDLSVGRNFNGRQPKSSLCMDNTGCLITKSQ